MREALTLLFLILSYNFLLWYVTKFDLSPIPLFPEDPHHVVLVLAYNSVLYISWAFGERHRTVQWIGYLFFFQIVALSVYFENPGIIVRDLPPVIFTFALVALFESPTEKRIRSIEKERDELLAEIDRVRREREKVEAHLETLREEIEKLEREKECRAEEISKEIEDKLRALQEELEEYREKERRLLETNRKLFQLLDKLRMEEEPFRGREELSNLRREKRRLVKEIVGLQELVEIYVDENERLKEENADLKRKIEDLNLRLAKVELEGRTTELDRKCVYRGVLEALFELRFSERAVEEFLGLPPEKKRPLLRELLRFSQGREDPEPLTTVPNVYKLRFSGGRVYLRKHGAVWEVVGILGSEDDKGKERYIRNVLSKID